MWRSIIILLLLLPARLVLAQDELVFVIRVDDVQSRSTIEPRSITAFEEIVEGRGGRITWAVIPHRLIEPQNTDGRLAAELRESVGRGHEIALHGYDHICERCGASSHEMFCVATGYAFSESEQRNLIAAGLDLMDQHLGLRPRTFVPPGHAMDATTLTALSLEGFDVLSTTDEHAVDLGAGVFNVAPTDEYTWALSRDGYEAALDAALQRIRSSDGYFALLLHDPFIRPGYEKGVVMEWVADLLDAVNAEYGPLVRYMTLGEAADLFRSRQTSAPGWRADATRMILDAAPNPFTSSTQITFAVARAGVVRLTAYDVLGRRVAILTDGMHGAGVHTITWDAATLPAGRYLLRLESDAPSATHLMTLAP